MGTAPKGWDSKRSAEKMGTAPKGWDSKRSAENALAVSVQADHILSGRRDQSRIDGCGRYHKTLTRVYSSVWLWLTGGLIRFGSGERVTQRSGRMTYFPGKATHLSVGKYTYTSSFSTTSVNDGTITPKLCSHVHSHLGVQIAERFVEEQCLCRIASWLKPCRYPV